MVRAAVVGSERRRPGVWSLLAFALASAGVVAATWLVVTTDGDPGGVLWPLVVAPLAITLAPVLVPRRGTLVGAAVALGLWCALTGFSIGFLLLPALAVQILAATRETE
jgi:FtsH-binding integral membrane protein